MDANPLVSCVMIFWNAAAFVEEAIQSVIDQTYPHWELLLVDDGSTDDSTSIAKSFAQRHPDRIFYLQHEGGQNLGMSASRNLGIGTARGDYVAFLDADDVWLPAKLAQQVAILNDEPDAGMIYGRTLIWHSWMGSNQSLYPDHMLDLGVPPDAVVQPPGLLLLMLENKVQSPTTCSVMVRRSLFAQVGMFEERFRGMYEDQAFFAKVQLNTPVYVAGSCWAKYRQHPNSCSAQADRTAAYEATRLPLLDWLADHVASEGMGPESDVWRRVRRERWLCAHPRIRRMLQLPQMLAWRIRSGIGRGEAVHGR